MRSLPLALALSAASLCGSPLSAQADLEREAATAFAKAMDAASRGAYARAVSLYKQVAEEYPGTAAGFVAAQRAQTTAYLGQADLVRHGPSANRLDVVVMGDGYRLEDQNEFDDVAKAIPKLFRQHKVLGEYYAYHNFVRVNLRSTDQGVSGFGREKDTALGGFVAGVVQGQVGVDVAKAQRWLAEVEDHDGYAIAIVKAGSMGTGGGGIAAIGGRADDTIIHEWGHAFGGLSDEYTTFTGHRGSPRTTINIAASDDPKRAPWAHFLARDYPGVGMYRGGDGRIKGAWRPTASGCAMAGGIIFCPVCREALVLQIHRYVDPIDQCEPPVDKAIRDRHKLAFEVRVMKPSTHLLGVRWYVLRGQEAIRAAPRGPFADRRQRGPLAAIAARPKVDQAGVPSVSKFTLDTTDLPAGAYQVVCRVEDGAQPSGQQNPWVLADPDMLLQSERVWQLQLD